MKIQRRGFLGLLGAAALLPEVEAEAAPPVGIAPPLDSPAIGHALTSAEEGEYCYVELHALNQACRKTLLPGLEAGLFRNGPFLTALKKSR